jgi:hypothetical protein
MTKMTKNKLDTKWFNLKNYEALKSMPIEDWQKILGERYEFCRHVKSCRAGVYENIYKQGAYFRCDFLDSLVPPEELLMKISNLLRQGVITNFGLGSFPSQRTLNNTIASVSSVNNLTVQDVVEMSKDTRLQYMNVTPNEKATLQEKQKHPEEMLEEPFEEEPDEKIIFEFFFDEVKPGEKQENVQKMLENPFEAVLDNKMKLELIYTEVTPQQKQKNWQEMLAKPFEKGLNGTATIKINLYATDEKLRNDFDQWLKDIRKSTGYEDNIPKNVSKKKLSKKKLYTQEDFDHWIKFGVIPYLDLMLVADIEYKVITQEELAPLIFPYESALDTYTRIGQITKPTADQLINNRMYKTLLAQLTS